MFFFVLKHIYWLYEKKHKTLNLQTQNIIRHHRSDRKIYAEKIRKGKVPFCVPTSNFNYRYSNSLL